MLLYSLPLVLVLSTLAIALRARATLAARPSRPQARKRGTARTMPTTPRRHRLRELCAAVLLEEVAALIVKVAVPLAVSALIALGIHDAANLPLEGVERLREAAAPTVAAHPAAPTIRYIYIPILERR